MSKLKGKEEQIIKMYKDKIRIAEIAKEFGVSETAIQRLLHKMKIPVKRGNYRPRRSKYNMKKRVFSPELIAKMKENTRINNEKTKFFSTVETKDDKFLVQNILGKSGAVANE